MSIMPIAAINEQVQTDTAAFLRKCDADFDRRLTNIAKAIRDNREERPIILLSGPSGSGKTTTAKMIEHKLDAWGFETHTLSMDDFFRPLTAEQMELGVQGKFDFESPDRVDIPLLNEKLEDILACKPTVLPRFRFEDSTRINGQTLARKPGELVILEGIHALNPSVITLPESRTERLYISVRTRLELADGTLLHPKRIRLMRRMLRDQRSRKRSPEETLRMFRSVQRGEERYITPFKERADFPIDTFCPYEVSVYSGLLGTALAGIEGHHVTAEIRRALAEFITVPPAPVAADALVREFIGGSIYD